MNRSYSGKEREMKESGANPEEKRSFWKRLFGRYDTGRERKVVEYVAHRLRDGAHLRDVLGEEYVRRNATPDEAEQILENPRLIEAAHEQMREDFLPAPWT